MAKNKTSWKPGKSGNQSGRPKQSYKTLLNNELASPDLNLKFINSGKEIKKNINTYGLSLKEFLVKLYLYRACTGDYRSFEFIFSKTAEPDYDESEIDLSKINKPDLLKLVKLQDEQKKIFKKYGVNNVDER